MLYIKVTELADGSVIAETPRATIGHFPHATRMDVIAMLRHKASECDEQVVFVEDFDDIQHEERVSIRHLMKRHF